MDRARHAVNARVFTATVFALALSVGGCRDKPGETPPTQTVARDSVGRRSADTVESGGEVVTDSLTTTVKERWITDANVVALMGAMNARQIAAADLELEAWHSDTVRAFAASMAREHAELQRSVDSIAARLNLAPVSPALAKPWISTMQAQIDSIRQGRGEAFDRAYVRQQVAGHQLMRDYILQLMAAAERPELRSVLEKASARVTSQLERARTLQTTLAAADSAAAARRASTRKRGPTTR